MEAVSERELVERCRSGDETAFQDLVDRHKGLVFALIARTVQDRSRAEDLAQEVFLRVHRGLPYSTTCGARPLTSKFFLIESWLNECPVNRFNL